MKTLREFFQKYTKDIFIYIILACVTFLFLYPSQRHAGFGDGDMFYHMKMAELISQNGVSIDFSWLPFTSLENYYANHHILYHILLIPFITLLPKFFGAKLLHGISIWLMCVGIYSILRSRKMLTEKVLPKTHALFFALLPFASVIFLIRETIPKAASFAVVYSLFFTYILMRKNSYLILFFASYIYVLLYGGWPLGFGLTCLWAVSYILTHKKYNEPLKKIAVVGAGLCAGIIINPYFPENIQFYYEQIIKIAVWNDNSVGFLAGEWVGLNSIWIFYAFSSVSMIILTCATILFVLNRNKFSLNTLFIFITSCVFFVLTIKSRRYIEYFVPYTALLGGYLWMQYDQLLQKSTITFWQQRLHPVLQKFKVGFAFIIVIFISSFGYIHEWKTISQMYSPEYFGYENYKDASIWMKENIPKDEIIFHTLWEEFPMLFFYNTDHKYISGLDPRFLVYGAKERAQLYYDIVQFNVTNDKEIAGWVQNDFKSHYILINKGIGENTLIHRKIKESNLFTEVYQDSYVAIYKL